MHYDGGVKNNNEVSCFLELTGVISTKIDGQLISKWYMSID
jgi:hypothetical protein